MVQARRMHFLSGTATCEGSVGSGDPSARSAEKIFNLHFSVVWIGSRSTFVLCTAPPKYYLFITSSYWAIIDLPAPLSCFSRGFARLTSSLANRVICACANLCRAKNRSGHGRTGRSGCYGPELKSIAVNSVIATGLARCWLQEHVICNVYGNSGWFWIV